MTIYVLLFLVLANGIFLLKRAISFNDFSKFSVGAQEVFPIAVILGGFMATHNNLMDLLGAIVPLSVLAFFLGYRKGRKSYLSTAEFLGDKYGKSVGLFSGIMIWLFVFGLFLLQAKELINSLEAIEISTYAVLALVGLYLIVPSLIGGIRVVGWNQLLLIFLFIVGITFSWSEVEGLEDSLTHLGSLPVKQLVQHPFSFGFIGSICLLTPFQWQGFWNISSTKIIKRSFVTILFMAIFLAYLLYRYGDESLGSFTLYPSLSLLIYRLCTLQVLAYYSAFFLVNDVLRACVKNPWSSEKVLLRSRIVLVGLTSVVLFLGCLHWHIECTKFLLLLLPLFILPLQVPFFAAVLNLESNPKEFFSSAFAALITYLAVNFGLSYYGYLAIPLGLLVGVSTFFVIHYTTHEGVKFVKLSFREEKRLSSYYVTAEKVKRLFLFPFYGFSHLRKQVDLHSVPYNLVGLLFIFVFLASQFLQGAHNSLEVSHLSYLNVAGFLLGLGLLLYPVWPNRLNSIFPFYWYFTLVYNLSFQSMVAYLALDQSTYALISLAFSVFLLARFVPGKAFLWLHIIGCVKAVAYYHYCIPASHLKDIVILNNEKGTLFLYVYFLSLIISYLFLQSRHYTLSYTEKALNYLSQEFLHLTTNVVGMAKSPASMLEWILGASLKESKKGEYGKVSFEMDEEDYNKMKGLLDDIKNYIDIGGEIIRRRSRYFAPIRKQEFSQHSALSCVESALAIFRRLDTSESSIPKVVCQKDFMFYGSDEHLEQVILNLISCTFAHCEEDVPKDIIIGDNRIIYKYFGKSISTNERPYLFTHLAYTQKSSGYYKEVGALPYVKKVMEAFDGDVRCYCHSDQESSKSYTKFTLSFPSLQKLDSST